jgi:hypothetical protein
MNPTSRRAGTKRFSLTDRLSPADKAIRWSQSIRWKIFLLFLQRFNLKGNTVHLSKKAEVC